MVGVLSGSDPSIALSSGLVVAPLVWDVVARDTGTRPVGGQPGIRKKPFSQSKLQRLCSGRRRHWSNRLLLGRSRQIRCGSLWDCRVHWREDKNQCQAAYCDLPDSYRHPGNSWMPRCRADSSAITSNMRHLFRTRFRGGKLQCLSVFDRRASPNPLQDAGSRVRSFFSTVRL